MHPLILNLLNTGKTVLKKYYGFNEVFNIFDDIDNNHHKLHEYNPRTFNMIKRKNARVSNHGMEPS